MADWVEETVSVYPGRDLLTFLSIRIGLVYCSCGMNGIRELDRIQSQIITLLRKLSRKPLSAG